MARSFRIDFGCTMTEIAHRGEAALLLDLQYRQVVGEGYFKIQDLTPLCSTVFLTPWGAYGASTEDAPHQEVVSITAPIYQEGDF